MGLTVDEFYFNYTWSRLWNHYRGFKRKTELNLVLQRAIFAGLAGKPGKEIWPFSIDEEESNKFELMTNQEVDDHFEKLAKKFGAKLPKKDNV